MECDVAWPPKSGGTELVLVQVLKGYFDHEKPPPPRIHFTVGPYLGPCEGPRGGVVPYEQSTPVMY
jgi:hypothetical protein